jgi:hypothetical protein
MGITLNSNQVATAGFAVVGYSANASACEEIVPAPGTGKFIILQHVTISNGPDGVQSITIGAGEAANDCEAIILGPFSMGVSTQIQFNFYDAYGAYGGGICLPVNKSLTVDSDDTHGLTIFVQGRVQ